MDPRSLLYRLHRALGPLAGGMILDALDLVTFGPIGLCGGFIIAAFVGWWISSIYRFSLVGRITFSVLAALYVAIPFTEIFPLATLVSAIARFWENPEVSVPSEPTAPCKEAETCSDPEIEKDL